MPPFTCISCIHTLIIAICPARVKRKSPKRRLRRIKRGDFEEVPRSTGTIVPANRPARRCARIAEAPPAADKARRFRGSAPVDGHDSACQPAGTTVCKNRRSACRGRRPLYSPHGIQNVRGHSIHIAQRVSGGRCACRAHCPQRAASAESGFFLVVSLRGAK